MEEHECSDSVVDRSISLPPEKRICLPTSISSIHALESLPDFIFSIPDPAARLLCAFAHVYMDNAWAKELDDRFKNLEYCKRVIETNKRLADTIEECTQDRNWKPLFMSDLLWRSPFPSGSNNPLSDEDKRRFVKNAWKLPYCDQAHRVLFDSLCEMIRSPVAKHKVYSNIAAIIQSSGYGKSRMVDEQSKLVFTFPFNLRNPSEMQDGFAHPVSDSSLRFFLLQTGSTTSEIAAGYFGFLIALFDAAAKLLQAQVENHPKFLNSSAVASWWREYLCDNTVRQNLYNKAIKQAQSMIQGTYLEPVKYTDTVSQAPFPSSDIRRKALPDAKTACNALRNFLHILKNSMNMADAHSVKVIMYFDEAHELAVECGKKTGESKRLRLDVLCTVLDAFTSDPMMVLLISTTPFLTQLAAPKDLAQSARRIEGKTIEHAPITELPFDCHPSFPLDPGEFSLDEISKLDFLAKFGRPLFWSLIESGAPPSSVLTLAQHQLDPSVSRHPTEVEEARTAVIDLLVMLDYEPDYSEAQALQQRLVSGHMRTAISFPSHLQFPHSCYPSEPFLAEAASSLLADWQAGDPDVLIDIVNKHFSNGLLHAGDLGELVARILLLSAYQRGCRQEQPTSTIYSKGCKVKTLLRSIFVKADLALAAKPDNIAEDPSVITSPEDKLPTLDEALGDAVVRFTHFAKFTDYTATSWLGVHAALLRGMAIICADGRQYVDIILPILTRVKGKACGHVVTAMLIQVKRRLHVGSSRILAVDEAKINFFPKTPEPCECDTEPLIGNLDLSNLPYISLILDFGIQPRLSLTPTRINPSEVASANIATASHFNFSVAPRPTRQSRPVHSRYSIYVRGLSPSLYCDVSSANQEKYQQLLRFSKILGGHPRQGHDQISKVMELKPFWVGGVSYSWLREEHLTELVTKEEEVFEVGRLAD